MSHRPRTKPIVILVATAGLALVAFLAFGVFGIHTLFIDDVVAEEAPTFAPTSPAPATTDEPVTEPDRDTEAAAIDEPEPDVDEPSTTAVEPVEPIREATGAFVDGDHPTEGTANVLSDGDRRRVLRLEEDFATDNGPDLNVYLATSADVDGEFVDLGDLKGNIGSQNYEIPADVDLSEFDTVVIWCVRFGVDFGSAPLVGA